MTTARSPLARVGSALAQAPPLVLALALAARVAVLCSLFFGTLGGFYFFSGDYPSRVVIAYEWLRHPSLFLGQMWLPVNFYVTAAVLKLWSAPTTAPNVFHILLSTATVGLVYAVARRLFPERRWAGLWAVALVAVEPTLVRLSLSGGASEVDVQFFLLGGALFFLRFLDEEKLSDLLPASAFFAAAGGTRHEAWCFLVFPSVELLRRAYRARRVDALLAVALMWAPAAAWIASRAADGYLLLLHPADVVKNATDSVRLSSGGARPWTELFWSYPKLLWRWDAAVLVFCAAGAVLGAGRGATARRYSFWLLTALLGYCLTPLLSIAFASAPERVSIVFLLFLAPFGGLALDRLARAAGRDRPYAIGLLLAAVLVADAGDVLALRSELPGSEPSAEDTIAMAARVARTRGALGSESKLLIEVPTHAAGREPNRIWDYVVFQYAAAPDAILDRRLVMPLRLNDDGSFDLETRTAPSAFDLDDRAFARFCSENRVGFALVRTPRAAAKLEGLMTPAARIGLYALYASAPDTARAALTKRPTSSAPRTVRRLRHSTFGLE